MIKKGTKFLDYLGEAEKLVYLDQRQPKTLEQSCGQKVLHRFAKKIKSLGFNLIKSTFFVREVDLIMEFIHIHKYSFGPYFRMHICIRVLDTPKEFIALSGPTETDFDENIKFEYESSEESIDACALKMAEFVENSVEPWFKKWRDRKLLLLDDSPLCDDEKAALTKALNSNPNEKHVARACGIMCQKGN